MAGGDGTHSTPSLTGSVGAYANTTNPCSSQTVLDETNAGPSYKNQIYTGKLRHPTLKGTKLTIYFPAPVPKLYCPYLGCNSSFLTYSGGNNGDHLELQKLLCHLLDAHKIETRKPVVQICLICNGDPGYRPNSHHCLENLQLPIESDLKFRCDYAGCGKAFRTSIGLTFHSRCHRGPPEKEQALDKSDTDTENNSVNGCEEDNSEQIVTWESQSSQSESRVTKGLCEAIILLPSAAHSLIGPSAAATKQPYSGEYRDPIVEGNKMDIYYPLPVPLLKCCMKDCKFTCNTFAWDKTKGEVIDNFLKLQGHFAVKHGVKIEATERVCLICQQTFVSSDTHQCLQNLKFSSQAELKFACEFEGCGQAFSTLVALHHHSKIHNISADEKVDFATALRRLSKKRVNGGMSEEEPVKKKLSRLEVNPEPQNNALDVSGDIDIELSSEDGDCDDSNDDDYHYESETVSDSTESEDGSTFYQLEDIGPALKATVGRRSHEQMVSSQLEHAEARGALQITSKAIDSSSQTCKETYKDDDVAGSSSSDNKQMYIEELRQPALDGANLTVYFPVPVQIIQCPYLDCTSTFQTNTEIDNSERLQLDNLRRHLIVVHHMQLNPTKQICLICNNVIVEQPQSHICLRNLEDALTSIVNEWQVTVTTNKDKDESCDEDLVVIDDSVPGSSRDQDFHYESEPADDSGESNDDSIVDQVDSSQLEEPGATGAVQPTLKTSVADLQYKKQTYTGELRQPTVEGTIINVYHPLPVSWLMCRWEGCTFSCSTYREINNRKTSQLCHLRYHIRDTHGIPSLTKQNVCIICNTPFRGYPKTHACLKNLNVPYQPNSIFRCDFPGCGRAFPRRAGLRIHAARVHKAGA